MTTPPSTLAVRQARRNTINRAITLLDTTSPATLTAWLAQTRIHAPLQADKTALRAALTDAAAATPPTFGAWKAAQQLLQAAGQPY